MGEIVDDIMDGACCAICGEYFQEEHGYPVACCDCWDPTCSYRKTIFETL